MRSLYCIAIVFALFFQGCHSVVDRPCDTTIIRRLDTNAVVTGSIVLLEKGSPNPFRLSCTVHGSERQIWATTGQTDYSGFLKELSDLRKYSADNRASYFNLGRGTAAYLDIQTSAAGAVRGEGIYYCTNIFPLGCYVGVFQRSTLVVREFWISVITNTGVWVRWKTVASKARRFVRGYRLVVTNKAGQVVVRQLLRVQGNTEALNSSGNNCLMAGTSYVAKIEALYQFKPTAEGYYAVPSEVISFVTPKGPISSGCNGEK